MHKCCIKNFQFPNNLKFYFQDVLIERSSGRSISLFLLYFYICDLTFRLKLMKQFLVHQNYNTKTLAKQTPWNVSPFMWSRIMKSSVIKQKGESQNGCFKKTKLAKFSEERTFLTPWYAHVRLRIRGLEMFVFRKIWRALFSWNTRFEILPSALLPMK